MSEGDGLSLKPSWLKHASGVTAASTTRRDVQGGDTPGGPTPAGDGALSNDVQETPGGPNPCDGSLYEDMQGTSGGPTPSAPHQHGPRHSVTDEIKTPDESPGRAESKPPDASPEWKEQPGSPTTGSPHYTQSGLSSSPGSPHPKQPTNGTSVTTGLPSPNQTTAETPGSQQPNEGIEATYEPPGLHTASSTANQPSLTATGIPGDPAPLQHHVNPSTSSANTEPLVVITGVQRHTASRRSTTGCQTPHPPFGDSATQTTTTTGGERSGGEQVHENCWKGFKFDDGAAEPNPQAPYAQKDRWRSRNAFLCEMGKDNLQTIENLILHTMLPGMVFLLNRQAWVLYWDRLSVSWCQICPDQPFNIPAKMSEKLGSDDHWYWGFKRWVTGGMSPRIKRVDRQDLFKSWEWIQLEVKMLMLVEYGLERTMKRWSNSYFCWSCSCLDPEVYKTARGYHPCNPERIVHRKHHIHDELRNDVWTIRAWRWSKTLFEMYTCDHRRNKLSGRRVRLPTADSPVRIFELDRPCDDPHFMPSCLELAYKLIETNGQSMMDMTHERPRRQRFMHSWWSLKDLNSEEPCSIWLRGTFWNAIERDLGHFETRRAIHQALIDMNSPPRAPAEVTCIHSTLLKAFRARTLKDTVEDDPPDEPEESVDEPEENSQTDEDDSKSGAPSQTNPNHMPLNPNTEPRGPPSPSPPPVQYEHASEKVPCRGPPQLTPPRQNPSNNAPLAPSAPFGSQPTHTTVPSGQPHGSQPPHTSIQDVRREEYEKPSERPPPKYQPPSAPFGSQPTHTTVPSGPHGSQPPHMSIPDVRREEYEKPSERPPPNYQPPSAPFGSQPTHTTVPSGQPHGSQPPHTSIPDVRREEYRKPSERPPPNYQPQQHPTYHQTNTYTGHRNGTWQTGSGGEYKSHVEHSHTYPHPYGNRPYRTHGGHGREYQTQTHQHATHNNPAPVYATYATTQHSAHNSSWRTGPRADLHKGQEWGHGYQATEPLSMQQLEKLRRILPEHLRSVHPNTIEDVRKVATQNDRASLMDVAEDEIGSARFAMLHTKDLQLLLLLLSMSEEEVTPQLRRLLEAYVKSIAANNRMKSEPAKRSGWLGPR